MGTMKRGVVIEGRGSQVRVQFDENDGVISPWLDVAQESTLGKRSFRRFKPGELVRCYLDRKGESGEALFAIYNDANPAPADSDELFYEEAADGSTGGGQCVVGRGLPAGSELPAHQCHGVDGHGADRVEQLIP